MTDIEMTKLCAEAMDVKFVEQFGHLNLCDGSDVMDYDPLHNDAQAMAMVRRFNLFINWNSPTEVWCTPMDQAKYGHLSDSPDCDDLNRAICECVAALRWAKP